MSKRGTFHVISRLYRDFPNFVFVRFWRFKKCFRVIFSRFFVKIWPKNMYRSSKSRNFFVSPFSPGDLRWPWPLLWSQSTGNDTYRCQWHYPCRLGWLCLCLTSPILLADVTKPEMSNILTLTWPVTSTRDPEVNKICFPSTVFPGLSNTVWIFRIGPVVSEIRGGGSK